MYLSLQNCICNIDPLNCSNCVYLIIPGLFAAEHNSGTEAPCGVDASTGDWDGGKMHHEHCKSNWKGCQYLCNNLENNKPVRLRPTLKKNNNKPSTTAGFDENYCMNIHYSIISTNFFLFRCRCYSRQGHFLR